MCTADAAHPGGDAFDRANPRDFDDAPTALAVAGAAMDYLNAAVTGLDGDACGELLIALGEVKSKLTAVHAGLLRRFDAADAHDADGYGSSSSWLAAKAGMPKKAASTAVRQMRQLGQRPLLNAVASFVGCDRGCSRVLTAPGGRSRDSCSREVTALPGRCRTAGGGLGEGCRLGAARDR